MATRAVIYARVSTKEQGESGYGLVDQETRCRAYAERNGLEVVEVIRDDTSGVTLLSERPGGRRLEHLVERRKVEAVIINEFSRLTRPPERQKSRALRIIEDWAEKGIDVHVNGHGRIDPDEMGGAVTALFGSHKASEERSDIVRRTIGGKRARAAAGHWIGILPPYGYDKVGERATARLVVNETEARIVRLIFEHFTGWGGREQLSLAGIVDLLNERRVATPGSKRNMEVSGTWALSNVRDRILKCRRFIGEVKSAGYVLSIPEVAIIEPELFEAAQRVLSVNRRRYSERRQREFYLMSGRFSCICGRGQVGSNASVHNAAGDKVYYRYYRCSGRYSSNSDCPQKNVKADVIDDIAWSWVSGLLKDEQALEDGLDELERRAREEAEPTRQELVQVERLLAKERRKIERLAAALGEMDNETAANALKGQLGLSALHIESLEGELKYLRLKQEAMEFTPAQRRSIQDMARRVRDRLDAGTNQDRRRLFDVLGVEGRLVPCESGGVTLKLECVLDSDTFCIDDGSS